MGGIRKGNCLVLHNLLRWVSPIHAICCNESQLGSTLFPHVFLSERVQTPTNRVGAKLCLLFHNCPAVFLSPFCSCLFTRPHGGVSNAVTQPETPLITCLFRPSSIRDKKACSYFILGKKKNICQESPWELSYLWECLTPTPAISTSGVSVHSREKCALRTHFDWRIASGWLAGGCGLASGARWLVHS